MKLSKWLCGLSLSAAVLAGLWLAGKWFWQNNLHAVAEGEAYRSAQMTASRLKETIGRLRLRAVINLRGANPGQEWYRREIDICRELGVAHYDVRLGAKQMPPPAQLARLVDLFRTAPKPVLIHCQAGADRAGFASVLYLITERGLEPRQAVRELSLRFGHLALFGYEEQDEFFDFYEKSRLPVFGDWLTRVYPDIYKVEKIENQWRD